MQILTETDSRERESERLWQELSLETLPNLLLIQYVIYYRIAESAFGELAADTTLLQAHTNSLQHKTTLLQGASSERVW